MDKVKIVEELKNIINEWINDWMFDSPAWTIHWLLGVR